MRDFDWRLTGRWFGLVVLFGVLLLIGAGLLIGWALAEWGFSR